MEIAAILLILLFAALLVWLLWPRIRNTVHGFRAGERFGTARAEAFRMPGLDSRITKEVCNLSRERPGRRRWHRWTTFRRGNTLGWRIGWVDDEWMPILAGEVQFQDLLGPGHIFVPESGQLSIGNGGLSPVPDALITGGQVFSLADIPNTPAELAAQSTAFIYFRTRAAFAGQVGQPPQGGQPAQGHHGHGPDAL